MHRLVEVKCIILHCGNLGVFDPHALWWYFYKRQWSDTFTVAQHRFYCRRCTGVAGFRVKKAVMELSKATQVNRALPLPGEMVWKKFLARYKG